MKHSHWSLTVAAVLLATAWQGMVPAQAQTRATGFQVGDRILLHVEGDSALTDTFTVVAGPALRLPNIGEVSLAGVQRGDIEAHLTRELGRYINDPVVQARALIRVSVVGEVTRPGFYAVPIDLVLTDALMLAGGATKDARVDRLQILRGNSSLWNGNARQILKRHRESDRARTPFVNFRVAIDKGETARLIMQIARHVDPFPIVLGVEKAGIIHAVRMFIDKHPEICRSRPSDIGGFFEYFFAVQQTVSRNLVAFADRAVHGDTAHAFRPASLCLDRANSVIGRTFVKFLGPTRISSQHGIIVTRKVEGIGVVRAKVPR